MSEAPQRPRPDVGPGDVDALAVLTDAVRRATGIPDAQPRGGQVPLTEQVWTALTTPGGQALAQAPTGSGKSLSYLVPAALLAATTGKRSVVSTESLALQAQIIDKDAPRVVEAVKAATGVEVDVQVLKGWSNWACLRSTLGTAHHLLGQQVDTGSWVPSPSELHDLADQMQDALGDERDVPLDGGAKVPRRDLAALTRWALRQHTDETGPGDRHAYPGAATDAAWAQVSVSPAECSGVKSCPLASLCKPAAAKDRASRADVVVTNHSLLAVQAAKRVAVVVGSRSLGRFDAVIVDEAHGLPGKVRDQGAGEVSGRRILSLVKAARAILHDEDRAVGSLLTAGEHLAQEVQSELSDLRAAHRTPGDVLRLPQDVNPLRGTQEMVAEWVGALQTMLNRSVREAGNRDAVRVRRIKSRLDALKADLEQVSEHRVGVARWVQEHAVGEHTYLSAASSPVDVAGALHQNLWTTPDEDAPEQVASSDGRPGSVPPAPDDVADIDLEVEDPLPQQAPRRALSVVAVSATLPAGFARQAGLSTAQESYESPFEAAYAESMLYVPTGASPADISALCKPNGTRRPVMDMGLHRDWAAAKMVELVAANGGAALILAATSAAGRHYAQVLAQASRGWAVHSQWDGPPPRSIVAAWKDDPSSVLVGTRSLMTGVDAPGHTNTLVIVDRVPRAAPNPVDDARVEDLVERAQMDTYSGRNAVYAVDAALLLEQAVGRLVRSTSDRGLVAVLDPRMLKGSPLSYAEATRRIYMRAVSHFGIKTMHLQDAVAFLRGRAAQAA